MKKAHDCIAVMPLDADGRIFGWMNADFLFVSICRNLRQSMPSGWASGYLETSHCAHCGWYEDDNLNPAGSIRAM